MSKVLIPLFERVVVRVETRTDSIHDKFKGLKAAGFKVPETEENKQIPDEGTVVAVGSSCDPNIIQIGDRVLFGKWAAKALDFQPGLYVCMLEDIIGLIADEEGATALRNRLPNQ